MRTGAAESHTGYFHEALYYASDEELLAGVVPFLKGGAEAGEPLVVALGEKHATLVREALGDVAQIRYLSGGDTYARPASAIRSYRRLMSELVADGASQIRIVGELAPAAFGPNWDWWARYESAINHAYDDFPLWSMCAYHSEDTPPEMLSDVARTHPWTAGFDGSHRASAAYTDPVTFLREPRPIVDDPIQRGAPVVRLVDPLPSDARHAILAADPCTLPSKVVDDFVMAASEAVTNALRHGQAPVEARLWVANDRMVLAVSDRGPGPKDPFAGLVPQRRDTPGGLGLWLIHQLCSHVGFHADDDGFTIRLTASA